MDAWQAVIVQALGDEGVLIVGNDTVRGFTSRDQVCFFRSTKSIFWRLN